MARLPRLTGQRVIRALRRVGRYEDHVRGSHVYLRHHERPGTVTVAVHAGKLLPPKTLQSILQQASISADEFEHLL